MENQIVDGVEAANFSALNCIDLSNPDIQQSVSLLKQACLDCGFFYVVNHGISQEFMEGVFAQSKRMFSLPLSEKMKLLRNEKNRGYIPVFDELLDPVNQVQRDNKEGYDIGVEVPEDDPDAEKPYYGPNIWPQKDQLPGWRETMEKFHQQALEVARSVARIIALALGLDHDFFDKPEMLGEPIALLRPLHYEGQSDPSKGIFGAGAHSDYVFITLLATDDILSLQICKDRDAKPQKWEYVAPIKGAFIVNLGDLLERWSNCIFKCIFIPVLFTGKYGWLSFVLTQELAFFVGLGLHCIESCRIIKTDIQLHTLCILVMIVSLSAYPHANQIKILQSFLQSYVRLIWTNATKIYKLILVSTTNMRVRHRSLSQRFAFGDETI